MTPTPQQPDVRELVRATVTKVRGDAWRQDFVVTDEDIADAVLAAVTPVIRRQVAEEIADDLTPEEGDRPWLGDAHCRALQDAAAIARSHSTQPETGEDHG